uniref:Large-conductance Ca2+-activated K+ channel beta2 subunit n=1 Tax=Rattus norvegicus TaxID=10116 RepID=B5BNW3_RAT|nr:large-conductance Ca2+-activated K+ channel beta2 subunit [Rattus norvegicus]
MFIWTSGRTSSSYRHDEKRNIYQKGTKRASS